MAHAQVSERRDGQKSLSFAVIGKYFRDCLSSYSELSMAEKLAKEARESGGYDAAKKYEDAAKIARKAAVDFDSQRAAAKAIFYLRRADAIYQKILESNRGSKINARLGRIRTCLEEIEIGSNIQTNPDTGIRRSGAIISVISECVDELAGLTSFNGERFTSLLETLEKTAERIAENDPERAADCYRIAMYAIQRRMLGVLEVVGSLADTPHASVSPMVGERKPNYGHAWENEVEKLISLHKLFVKFQSNAHGYYVIAGDRYAKIQGHGSGRNAIELAAEMYEVAARICSTPSEILRADCDEKVERSLADGFNEVKMAAARTFVDGLMQMATLLATVLVLRNQISSATKIWAGLVPKICKLMDPELAEEMKGEIRSIFDRVIGEQPQTEETKRLQKIAREFIGE